MADSHGRAHGQQFLSIRVQSMGLVKRYKFEVAAFACKCLCLCLFMFTSGF